MANQKEKKQKIEKNKLSSGFDTWPKKELFLLEPKTLLIIIFTSVLTLLVAFLGESGFKFLTSVVSPGPEHAPFDGTTFPIKQIPNWVKLTEAERKLSYSALPAEKLINLPAYNPTRLVIPMSTLKWNDPNDDLIRNEKITYSVPYIGTYKLDGLENTGSHPGIDIKIPEGTPIYAIANGTVIKAQYSNGGFGNHVVIQHNNFPSPDDENSKETFYSSYSHLSSIAVKVNDVVTKGQMIGNSGSSGIATTPHLHFQIDNSNAPWHPYWPFASSEMKAAGLSFFEAINSGFKKENAALNTINPMRYAQKYFGNQALVASIAPIPNVATPETDEYENLAFMIQLIGGPQFEEGETVKFAIQAFDEKGNLISNPAFPDNISVSLLNGSAELNKTSLSAAHFKSGISNDIEFQAKTVSKDKLILRFREREFSSQEFEIISKKTEPKAEEAVVSPVEPQEPPAETPAAAAPPPYINITSGSSTEETSGNSSVQTDKNLPFSDVADDSPYYAALTELKSSGLVAGYADGSFKPEKEVSRAEAITFILRAIDELTKEKTQTNFPDVSVDAWYAKFVATAYELGFVKGYPDGYFRPDSTVTLAEFFTMLFVAAKTDVDPQAIITLPQGIGAEDWFMPYLQEAIRKNILEISNNAVEPGKALTRGEIAKFLWKLKDIKE